MRVLKSLLLLAGAAFLAACGSEGGSGGGATTYLTSTIKDGTPLVAYSVYSTASKYIPAKLTFTVKSNVYTGVTPSDVQITSQRLTYTPIAFETYSSNKKRISPEFTTAPVTLYVPSLVPGGGSVNIENYPVFTASEVAALKPLVDADPAKFSKRLLKYKLDVAFFGYEVRTNKDISSSVSTEVWVETP